MTEHESELKIVGRIKSHEGELNEREPAHVGGVSYRGITQRTFQEWIEGEGKHKAKGITNVRQLVDHPDVVDAFYHDYLKNAWHLPECLQYMYCDFYTNGQANATKITQRMVGIDDDGIWGSGTTKAVQAWTADITEALTTNPFLDNELILDFHEQKLAHYESLKTKNPELYNANIAGWKKRAMRVLAEHQEYFEDDEPVATAVDPEDMPPAPPVESTDEWKPYCIANLTLTDFEAWIGKYLKKGYVLHSCNLIPNQDNKMLVVVEHNPEKAGKLLNT